MQNFSWNWIIELNWILGEQTVFSMFLRDPSRKFNENSQQVGPHEILDFHQIKNKYVGKLELTIFLIRTNKYFIIALICK